MREIRDRSNWFPEPGTPLLFQVGLSTRESCVIWVGLLKHRLSLAIHSHGNALNGGRGRGDFELVREKPVPGKLPVIHQDDPS